MSKVAHSRAALRLVATVRNWPMYVLHRFGRTTGNTVFRLRNGFVLQVRPFSIDRAPLHDVWLSRSYDPTQFGVPFSWSRCRTIVDVGAHIGAFTLYAAAQAPNARIFAIEPEASNAALLKTNVAANGLDNRVSVHQMAIGSAASEVLYVSPNDSGGHSTYRSPMNHTAVEVPAMSLGEFFHRNGISECDFLKLDCEGAEYDALYGMPSNLLDRIKLIALEYHHFTPHPKHTPEAMIALLTEHQFRVVRHHKSMFIAYR